jgi:hypothetical protein
MTRPENQVLIQEMKCELAREANPIDRRESFHALLAGGLANRVNIAIWFEHPVIWNADRLFTALHVGMAV